MSSSTMAASKTPRTNVNDIASGSGPATGGLRAPTVAHLRG